MLTFQCWFCEREIERSDSSAVMITVENMWRWEADAVTADDPTQQIYAHTDCAKEKLAGPSMTIEPSVFLEDE